MKNIYLIGGIIIIILGVLSFFMSSQHKTTQTSQTPQTEQVAQPTGTATSGTQPAEGKISENTATSTTENNQTAVAVISTSMGDITLELNAKEAPNAVANFIKLAKSGFYDGTKFHRVIKGFMIQGGDPLSKDDSKQAQWGTGGPGYSFNDEIGTNDHNGLGVVAMANSGPNTNGSQFFINVADNGFLDGKYTVFGNVTNGMETAMTIEKVPTGQSDRPLTPVVIQSITIK